MERERERKKRIKTKDERIRTIRNNKSTVLNRLHEKVKIRMKVENRYSKKFYIKKGNYLHIFCGENGGDGDVIDYLIFRNVQMKKKSEKRKKVKKRQQKDSSQWVLDSLWSGKQSSEKAGKRNFRTFPN